MDRTTGELPAHLPPTCEEARPLLAAASVGALDRTDAHVVANHLLRCPNCRQELDRYRNAVDYIGFAVPQVDPRPSLRKAILAVLTTNEPTSHPLPWRWVTSVAAALIVVLLAGNLALQLHRFGTWQTTSAPATRAASAQASQLVWYDLTSVSPAAGSGRGVLCAQQNGNLAWLIVQDLPQLPAGQTYQAWLTSGDQRFSAGTFTVDPLGRGFLTIRLAHPIDSYSLLGVTGEPAGGSPTPTGPRLLSVSF